MSAEAGARVRWATPARGVNALLVEQAPGMRHRVVYRGQLLPSTTPDRVIDQLLRNGQIELVDPT